MNFESPSPIPWYRGITSYQWLVLVLASAGWVFDVYEGQIYAVTRDHMLGEIILPSVGVDDPDKKALMGFYGNLYYSIFLTGGALGGILCGSLADRWGRRPMLIATILTYSLFSGLTYWADSLWEIAVLRFLVAIGVGGEWSVAASFVAEEFPTRARAQAGGIFQASSILGTWMAGLVAMAVDTQWRYAYLVGVAPALLVVFIRLQVKESPGWQKTQEEVGAPSGSLVELLRHPLWRRHAILGLLLATVGLATFWTVTVAGKDLTLRLLKELHVESAAAQQQSIFAYAIVETAGGGLGLLAFGPLAALWGRRKTFVFYQLTAVCLVPLVCYLPATYEQMLCILPLYGFFTLGMHAGFAIYFPELFPVRLRATGAGFCFSGGRLTAALILFLASWLSVLDVRLSVSLLALQYIAGIFLILMLPETKGQPLPEDITFQSEPEA
jgi:MFS family permease